MNASSSEIVADAGDAMTESEIPVLPNVGAQLLAAREKAGLTVADIANSLKLGTRQVEALESGNWQVLPGNTFIRGFVRNYARLVHVDAAPLMRQLDDLLEEKKPVLELHEGMHVEMPGQGRLPQRRDLLVIAGGLGLVLLAALIYFLLPDDLSQLKASVESGVAVLKRSDEAPPKTVAASGEPILPPGATLNQVMNPQSAQVQASETPVAPPTAAPMASAEVKAENKSDVPAAPTSGDAALKMTFSRESWVEVRDRRGNVILSQRGQPGNSREVDGAAPLTLVIGYAPGVTLTYRGQAVDLAPHTKGDVARLTLE